MGSGVIQGLPVASASYAPPPVASVVSVVSVPPVSQPVLTPATRQQETKETKETKMKDSTKSTPTSPISKEGSPRGPRFFNSGMRQTSEETSSPRNDSPKSKPTSPRSVSSGPKKSALSFAAWLGAKSPEEAPWEVPYSMRANRSGSLSPAASSPQGQRPVRPQRSESQKRRYQDLYEDHEIRLQKWQAKLEEKKRKEEEELQKNIANTCSPRNFSQHQFQNWPEA